MAVRDFAGVFDVLLGQAKVAAECGNSKELLRLLPDNSVDSIVTDPPYELTATKGGKGGFMGKAWDATGIAHDVELWAECLRVLKPGGHLLAFSGARTYHRMACAIEDGGFEIRDQLLWLYGSGMPKSRNIAKYDLQGADAAAWEGWGTGLKPSFEPLCMAQKPFSGISQEQRKHPDAGDKVSHEPIVMARKPLEKGMTVAANVLKWGVGAINIDGCRVGTELVEQGRAGRSAEPSGSITVAGGALRSTEHSIAVGRWPANIIHDGSPEVVALFPAEAGASAPVMGTEASAASVGRVTGERARVEGAFHADTGSAARFFYCTKASSKDRHDGCENPGPQFAHGATLRDVENTAAGGNNHPTVKPTELMRYLVRLVTPPGGVVLDPFMGSGSTGRGARLEGCRFIGFDLSPEYVEISRRRIGAAERQEAAQARKAAAPVSSPKPTKKAAPAPACTAAATKPEQMELLK